MRRSLLLVAPVIAALVLAACGSSGGSSSSDNATPTIPPAIYTAAKLTPLSTALLDAYKADHSDTKLVVKGGDMASLTKIMTAKLPGVALVPTSYVPAAVAASATTIGHNELIFLTPSNGAKVTNLAEYKALPPTRRTQCIVYVPADCTAGATQALATNQLDAAIVWRSGFTVPTGVKVTSIPDDQNVSVDLSSVILGDSSEAKSFGDFLQSDAAKKVLTEQGMLP